MKSKKTDANKGVTPGLAANAQVVRKYLEKIKFHFTEDREDASPVFHGSICAECAIIDVFQWRIVVEEDCVQSFFLLPTHVAENRRKAVAEYCMYVNWPLKYGKLMEDIGNDGELMFHLCVPSASLKGDPDVEVDRLIGLPAAVLERFTPGIIDVLQGRDPREAYAACESRDFTSDETEEGQEGGQADDVGDKPLEKSEQPGPDGTPIPVEPTDLAPNYSLEGLNVQGNVPLAKIVAAVRRFREGNGKGEDTPRLNILLSGPSGCGKTEFVKYLGREVGAEVMTVTASDVLSPMAGRTEQLLAKVFREARASKSILFLDEIDSLLSSRSNARQNWEVTQVNELLQQMERFGGILVGATNFVSNLDSAVARRFTFKVKMDYLTDEGKSLFFTRYFKTTLSPEEQKRLKEISNLTPGDFRTVRQSLYYLEDDPDNDRRLAGLEAEAAAKGSVRSRIGF